MVLLYKGTIAHRRTAFWKGAGVTVAFFSDKESADGNVKGAQTRSRRELRTLPYPISYAPPLGARGGAASAADGSGPDGLASGGARRDAGTVYSGKIPGAGRGLKLERKK